MKFIDGSDPAFIASAKIGAFRGAVENLSNREYHSLSSYWSSTDLKFMYSQSPMHFRHEYIDKIDNGRVILKARDNEPTASMILGSLVHTMLLAPKDFEKEFFVMPALNFRTNEGKARREEMLAANPGKYAITDEMLANAQSMVSSAENNPQIKKLLEPGKKESAFFWSCPFSGLNFKAKLDHASSQHWCEVKTTSVAESEHFSRHAYNLNYDLSIYHYREALNRVMQLESPMYFIVIEQEHPFVTQSYKVGPGFLETGHAKWINAVTKLADGVQKNKWPGYYSAEIGIPEINPPSWAINKLGKEDSNEF